MSLFAKASNIAFNLFLAAGVLFSLAVVVAIVRAPSTSPEVNLVTVGAAEASKAFHQNELSAVAKYGPPYTHTHLFGAVESVSVVIGSPVITLVGHRYRTINAFLGDDQAKAASHVKVGEVVDLLCASTLKLRFQLSVDDCEIIVQ